MNMKTTFPVIAILLAGLLVITGMMTINYLDARDRLALHDKLWHFAETCTPIIAWIEAEHIRTGAYPSSLPAEFDVILSKIEPDASYETSQSNTVFSIGFGDYAEDWFHYYWNSDRGEWMWDG